jgi:hypothetical protein
MFSAIFADFGLREYRERSIAFCHVRLRRNSVAVESNRCRSPALKIVEEDGKSNSRQLALDQRLGDPNPTVGCIRKGCQLKKCKNRGIIG